MQGAGGTERRLAVLALPLAVLALLLTSGATVGTAVPTPSAAPLPGVTINGSWTISTPVSYSNTSLYVNGSITIASGGSLTLQNVQLSLAEPSSLAHGIEVDDGGGLFATASTFESATASNPLWIRANAGAQLSLVGGSVQDLGGPASPLGVIVDAAGSVFDDVTFNNYYEALVVSATDVTVENCTFEHTTSSVNSTWVVSTSGTSSGFVMTHSRVVDTSMAGGALSVTSASDIENNTFTLDPGSTVVAPILIGYASGGKTVNASGTKFAYNTVTGGDVSDYDSSNVIISHNQIKNLGGQLYHHDIGILVTVWTLAPGAWISNIQVEHNFISNATSQGIRVTQDVTNVVIAYNNITNASLDPLAGVYNGAETYEGIYLIRGVTHALVYDNQVDNSADQESSSISTGGVGLESEVDDTTVANNTILNTDLGIWVQGDWNDGSDNIGPSLHNTITGNTIRNTLPVVQTHDLASAIQNYDWANYTTISDNLIEGWQMVPSGDLGTEGEAIHQADDFGTIEGNVVNGAVYGVVLGYFYGNGVSNASYNVVYGNSFNVTGSAVVVNPSDTTPGPIVNVEDVLTSQPTSSGFPTVDLQSIGPARGVSFSESAGRYYATLETSNPVTGLVENFTTSIAWGVPAFSVQAAGNLGSGSVSAQVTFVNSTRVTYSVSPSGTLYDTVSLNVPSQEYSAAYTVQVISGPDAQTFTVDSSAGPATFETNWTGTVSIAVNLDSWTAITTNNSTTSTVDLELSVTTPDGDPVPGVLVQVGLDQQSESTSVMLGPTDGTGGASLSGLPNGTSVANLTLEASGYTLESYSVVTPQPDLIQLNVVVVPVNSETNTTNTTTYQVKFTEVGLAPGAAWWVSVSGPESVNVTLSGTAITFNLPGGSYHYALGAFTGANTTAPGGTFVLPAGTSLLVVNSTFTQPVPSKSTPPAPGTTPASGPWSLPSWAVAVLYLVVAAFEVGLVFGMYRMFRSDPRSPSSKPPKAGPRRDRTRPRKR